MFVTDLHEDFSYAIWCGGFVPVANRVLAVSFDRDLPGRLGDIPKYRRAGVKLVFGAIFPADLSISLSAPLDYGSPRFVDALKEVLRACEKQGKIPGIHAIEVQQARRWIDMGFRFISISSDIDMLRTAVISMLGRLGRV